MGKSAILTISCLSHFFALSSVVKKDQHVNDAVRCVHNIEKGERGVSIETF